MNKKIKFVFFSCFTIFSLWSCNQKNPKIVNTLTPSQVEEKQSEQCMILASDTADRVLKKPCIIKICAYPEIVGPDFYTLYDVIDVLFIEKESLSESLKKSKILIEKCKSVEKYNKNVKSTQKRYSEKCKSKSLPIVVHGNLFFVKDKLIDKTTGAKYTGYYLLADTVQKF